MKRFWFLLSGFWLSAGLALSAADAPLVLTVRAEGVSFGESVLLGEVAVISGAAAIDLEKLRQLPIARAPLPAQSRALPIQELQTAVRQTGDLIEIDFRGAPAVKVTAAAQTITGRHLADAAMTAVRNYWAKDADLDLEVVITSLPADLILRPGEVRIEPELSNSGVRPGAQSVRVRVLQAERVVADPVAGLNVHIKGSVHVAAERLGAGDILTASGIKTIRKELNTAELEARCDPQKLIGLRARRTIIADEPLHRSFFAAPQVIHRGDAVTVLVKRGALELAARGEARGDAALDEPVRVLVQDSNAEIVARASGLREATLDDPALR